MEDVFTVYRDGQTVKFGFRNEVHCQRCSRTIQIAVCLLTPAMASAADVSSFKTRLLTNKRKC